MRFKKLELFGFKSFAEKTKIIFEPGVTAIVGPNGCGKSNIADSIKWVLGEQRPTALRGSSMGDVIFNGTDTRESINIAEVSLTLSNEDKRLPIEYNEVTVTRRIYRSGESEYFLNKTRVRLKDIQELFHGTGVGTVSYSLIEQGKIDLILSTKPDDRRYIFDEAAGITKYKAKKDEALRKLEHTVNNLQRVDDIINEVSRQIGSIERQARKAQRYKEKFEKLKELELKHSYHQLLQLKNGNNAASLKKDDIKKEENALLSDINEVEKKIEIDRSRLEKIEESFSGIQTQKINTGGLIENSAAKIELNHERIKELNDKINSLNKQKEALNQKVGNLKEKINAANFELDEIKRGVVEKKEFLQEKEELLTSFNKEIEVSSKIVKENKAEVINLASTETKINNELVEIKANLQNINARLRRLKLEKEDVEAEREESNQRHSNLKAKAEEASDGLNSLREDDQKINQELELTKNQLTSLGDKLNDFNHKVSDFKSKLKFLRDLRERFEGYSKSVKTLLVYKKENKLPFKGLRDSVANLIRVKGGYEIPVEMALGVRAQDIVIENREQAESAVNFLKNSNLGWVNFLPLSNFKHEEKEDNRDLSFKTLGLLSKFVDTDREYEQIISYLLSNIYLVRDATQAKELIRESKFTNSKIRFITQKGEIITKNSISGGSYFRQEESSLIGRDAKINKLQDDCREVEEEIPHLESALEDKKKEVETLDDKIKTLRELIHQEDIKKANIESELTLVLEELKKFEDEIVLLDSEVDDSETEKKNLLEKQENHEIELNSNQERNSEVQNIITTNQQLVEERSKEIQESLLKITQIRTELLSVDKIYSNKSDTCESIGASIEEIKGNMEQIEADVISSSERVAQLDQEIITLTSNNKNLETEKGSLEVKIDEVNKDRQSILNIRREQDLTLRKKQVQLSEVRENLHGFDVKNTEYSLRLDNLKDKVLSTYHVDLDGIDLQIEEDINWSRLEEDINKFKKQLESMGNVNLVAIDEHQELKERFDFLTHQQQDLEEAKESLHKTIRKINHATTKMFKETFELIRQTFEEFFKLLFGGGSAKLVLVDEHNVLESGIEIIARPPGKKLQNITLMSGGERALCAIALLFAVFKIKPSPFCVLDEIDAPLDESNIVRFTRVLQEFVKTSQFIIITHNKKTIGMADIMYGVTMEESGISKIVSVKFVDEKEKKDDKEKEPAAVN